MDKSKLGILLIKVSIIIPVYNTENLLERCLDSVINQTLKDIEIIIINDGSSDNSQKILNEYANRDNRIKLIIQENKGLSSVKNLGVKVARADIVSFVDSDDSISLNMIETMYNKLVQSDADICVCKFYSLNFNNIQKQDSMNYNTTLSQEEIFLKYLAMEYPTATWLRMYKKELFIENEILFPEGMYYEDTFTTYKLHYFSNKTIFINSPLYNYYANSNSITSNITYKHINNMLFCIKDTEVFLIEQKLEKKYKLFYIQRLNWCIDYLFRNLFKSKDNKSSELLYLFNEIKMLDDFKYINKVNYIKWMYDFVKYVDTSNDQISKAIYTLNNSISFILNKNILLNEVYIELLKRDILSRNLPNYYVYGVGQILESLFDVLDERKILGIIDTYKYNKLFKNFKVTNLKNSSIEKSRNKIYIIITSIKFIDEIETKINDLFKESKCEINIISLKNIIL